MATHRQKYVSVFKIDGVPILPPLMTAEKCREMQRFKELAMQIELRKSKQPIKDKNSTLTELQCNLLRHGHSHIPQPQTPRRQPVEISSPIPESKRERMEKLRQTDTMVYDNRANSIILTLEGFEEETDFQSVEIEKPQTLDQNENIKSSKQPKSPANKDDTPQRPQPYAAFIPIPSICVNPPTPCAHSNPICETPPSRRLCSPSLKPEPESNLIRSNSFTLDGPSSALLEHIKNQKLKKSTATQDTVESKAKRVQKAEIKSKSKSPSSPNLCHFTSNTSIFKSKRSPYDVKQSSKTKLRGKHKIVKPVTPKKVAHNADHLTISLPSTPKSPSKSDMLRDIEEQHRARFVELVRQQQAEQKRLQEQFETQQKLLLEQLSARMAKAQLQSPSPTIDSPLSSHSPSPEQDSITSSRLTPRRRLFAEKPQSAGTSQPQDLTSPRNSIRRQEIKMRRQWAATKISAYARGYLTRRLFKTDYVQRIVQTIKDTLIFVLNLHLETSNDTSEASIKLKARLLQQLTSATRTLHVIFFESNIKERMEIISRDRKFMQAKLLNMKRSPRIMH